MLDGKEHRLTNESMKTYTEGKAGAFKAGAKLEEFGKNQNHANEMLALNVNDLIKRVCAIEDRNVKYEKNFKMIADELTAFKNEIDRLKLTAKLNSNAVDRLTKAISIASGEEVNSENAAE